VLALGVEADERGEGSVDDQEGLTSLVGVLLDAYQMEGSLLNYKNR